MGFSFAVGFWKIAFNLLHVEAPCCGCSYTYN